MEERIKINILGSEWSIVITDDLKKYSYLDDCNGYCDPTVKECIIQYYVKGKDFEYANTTTHMNKTIRHEIIHAYLYESGLWHNSLNADLSWAMNEEMVDWLSIQLPKIYDTLFSIEDIWERINVDNK